MVIIVFCMTVLLGIGGTAAYALWEQGAHPAGKDRTVNSAPSVTSAP